MHSTVAVVITTFNQAPFIAATVESVLRQTVPATQIVVVDDGSTDDTPRILERFRGRVDVVRQQNTGVAGARNAGVLATSADLVAFLDGDDLWVDTKLDWQLRAWREFPEAGLIAGDVEVFDGDQIGHREGFKGWLFSGDDDWARCVHCYERLLINNPIWTTSQIMIPRQVLRDIGLSDRGLKIASDYDLYLRIAERWPFALINRVLTRWRYIASSVSGPREHRQFRWEEDMLRVLRKHAALANPDRRSIVDTVLSSRLERLIRDVYYRGTDESRQWAIKFLLSVGLTHRTVRVVPPVAALLLPNGIKAGVKKLGLSFQSGPRQPPRGS